MRGGLAWYNLPVFFAQPAPPVTPIIVKVVDQPAKEISVADILMGSVGLTGLFLIGAAALGLVLGGIFIAFRRWQASRDVEDAPSDAFRLTQPPRENR